MAYNNDSNCLSSETEANFSGFFPLDGCPPGKWGKDTTYVGNFAPNAWGLYDMHGNVWEWVWDVYRADYENLSAIDPAQDDGSPGSPRVLRGGGWKSSAAGSRSAFRGIGGPVAVVGSSGVRLVRSAL
jgi:formylglycine-generating enzyme required for sulfatase activity